MAATFTLTGNLSDIVGDALPYPKSVDAFLVANIPAGDALVDQTGQRHLLGSRKIEVDENTGAFTVAGVVDTDATDLNVEAGTLRYQVVVKYRDGAHDRQTYTSGWFEMTANANLATLARDASPMAIASASQYALAASASATVAAASAAAAAAALELAEEVAGANTADDLIVVVDANPASDLRVQQDARHAAAYAAKSAQTTVESGRLSAASLDATIAASAEPLTVGGKRAVRKDELTFNVVDYGAVSGGTGDDTAAFQAAVDAAAATSTTGGEVFIPVGSFHVTNVIVPDRVKIRGAGQRASKVTATATGAAFEVGKETVLSDFYVTGTTIADGIGIKTRPDTLHLTLRDMSITGHATGVTINNSYVIQLRDTQIQSCGNGLHLTGTVGCNIVTVSGGEVQGCTNGVVIDGANNYGLKFFGTTVEGNTNKGFAVNGATYGLTIRDCYMEANPSGHIFFQGLGHFGPTIAGCFFSGAAAFGVNVPVSLNVRDITVEHNMFMMTTAASRTLYLGSGVIVAHVVNNHTWSASAGAPFDPDADFLGSRLVHEANGKLNLRASAATLSSGGAPINIPHGTAPSSPINGDIWTTTAGLYVRINGVTVGPLS